MNIRQLEVFSKVAETESITLAAKQLFMSQPAVSKTIRELESDLGISLFDRIDNRLYLNGAGKAFRIRATQLLRDYYEVQDFGRGTMEDVPLRIGTSLTIGNQLLPQVIQKFKKQYPKTPLKIFAENVNQIKGRLIDGDIEIAFIEGFEPRQSFESTFLSEYELFFVGSPKYFKHDNISRETISELPLLLREPGSTLRDYFDNLMHQLGLEVEPMLTSSNTEVLIKSAIAGLGLTILPEPLARPYFAAGELVNLSPPGTKMLTKNYAITLKGSPLTDLRTDLIKYFQDEVLASR